MSTAPQGPAPRRVALRQTVTRDDIDVAIERAGWRLTNIVPPTADRPGQLVLATQRGRTALYMIDDMRLGITYFAASGADPEAALDEVIAQLEVSGLEEAAELMRDPDDVLRLRRGMGLMALLEREPDPDTVRVMARALEHPDSRVRGAAATAASYALWPGLRPALERMRDADPLDALRAAATQILGALPS